MLGPLPQSPPLSDPVNEAKNEAKRLPDIPCEIWILIAQLIPDHVLWDLRSLNSAFFQAAMDARYREISLFDACLDEKGWTKTLERWERLR
jgi:hypothetical protein